MERILAGLDAPQRSAPVLLVGGTNGKGSVARIWDSVLRAAGYRTGLYTSPHLVAFRERFLVEGAPLPDRVLEELAEELRPALVRFGPTFFEASTILAFLAFARAEVDVMVVEVGLGGRLDATNVVSPVLTAITNVSMEHSDLLGSTLAEIAREKAGIFKPGVPAYTSAEVPEVLQVLTEEAAAVGVPLSRIRPPEGEMGLGGIRCTLRTRRWGRLELAAPVAGRHQLSNLALAVRSLEALPPRLLPTARAVIEGVAQLRIPGRMQIEEDPPRRWILDVAHNPEGITALVETLRGLPLQAPVVAVTGILSDKEWGPMLRGLAEGVDANLLVVPDGAPRARRWDPDRVVETLPELDLLAMGETAEAFQRARELTRRGGTIVVTGSSHTVGAALRDLDRLPLEALPPSDDFE
jgi:dihydrofolate synthase / folylpolyglutamate synthase